VSTPADRQLEPTTPATSASRQLSELPTDELEHLAEEFGIDPTAFPSRQHLVSAIHDRRQAIANMDRDAMLDVVKWGRRPVSVSATKEQIAQEIARITSMNFAGLSHRGLLILSRMRGIRTESDEPVPSIIRKLKKQEGLLARLNRKRRAVIGSLISRAIGEDDREYHFLPPTSTSSTTTTSHPPPHSPTASIREEIEESGVLGGIAGRIKRQADSYLNQKLDEIEARIDRKLDEIDRRLAEWRDKEIANRIRILKITLWVSVILAGVSLIYSYIKVYFWPH
jgi:hypothetical protein